MLHAVQHFFASNADRAPAEFAFTCLARTRFLTVASLMALAGPRGLRPELLDEWVKARLVYRSRVTVDVLSGAEIEYVALTARGARALESATGRHAEGITSACLRHTSQKRRHDLAVGEFVATFLALENDGDLQLFGVEVDEKKIGTSVVVAEPGCAPERIPLRPDALVVVDTPAGPSAILCEVDMGTTTVSKVARKLAAYIVWQREDGPERDFAIKGLRIALLTTNEQRAAKIHDATSNETHGLRSGFILFGTLDAITVAGPERIFDPIVRQLGAERGHHVPLFSEPQQHRLAS